MNYLLLLMATYLAVMNSRFGEVDFVVEEWRNFKTGHGRNYADRVEENMRRSIYAYNKHQIALINEELEREEAGYTLGENQLTDLTGPEIAIRNGFRLPEDHELRLQNTPEANAFVESLLADNSSEVPDELDWRQVPGRVTRVKDQGQCGSCWAFASVGTLEGQEKVRKAVDSEADFGDPSGTLVELSEQNLVDCDQVDSGCEGGLMKDALEFVHQENGIDDESSYPYEHKRRKCRFNKSKVAFDDKGAAVLKEADEENLKQVVAKFGPVSVAIDASSIHFQFYRHGVYYRKHCGQKLKELDHAVLVVGYGTDPKQGDYWIVKNSWGSDWGEKGYIRMARNRKNNCGIATVPTIPTF